LLSGYRWNMGNFDVNIQCWRNLPKFSVWSCWENKDFLNSTENRSDISSWIPYIPATPDKHKMTIDSGNYAKGRICGKTEHDSRFLIFRFASMLSFDVQSMPAFCCSFDMRWILQLSDCLQFMKTLGNGAKFHWTI
jgi:hypothetical protein